MFEEFRIKGLEEATRRTTVKQGKYKMKVKGNIWILVHALPNWK